MEEWLVCRLKCSFEILSETCVANSCGRAAGGDDVGRLRFAVLCRMLLIVSQRARGLDQEAYNDFLAAAINLWQRMVVI